MRTGEGEAPLVVRFDSEIFAVQRRGGISNYFLELLEQFETQEDVAVEARPVPGFAVSDEPGSWPLRRLPRFLDRRLVRLAANRLLLNALIRLSPAQAVVLHSTFYDMKPLRSRKVRRVVTVHDMIPELFPEQFPGGNPHRYKRAHVEQADVVICVSETTRRDLLETYGRVSAPIVVTPLAPSELYYRPARPPVVRPFLLFVGQRGGYKNFEAFVRCCELLEPDDIVGIVVGSEFTAEEIDLLHAHQVSGKVTQVAPTNVELAELYRSALALIYPSRYEGFGLPVLEAMASGCPCVLSTADALKEVGGGAALHVDPADWAGYAAAVRRISSSDELRADLVSRGLRRASEFSWARTARQTAAGYRVA